MLGAPPCSSAVNSHGLPSAPRASITASTPVASKASRICAGRSRPPVRITGRGQRAGELGDQLVVGFAAVLDGGGARVEGDPGDPRLGDEPVGELEAALIAGAHARAQLGRDGHGLRRRAERAPSTAAAATARARSWSHSSAAPAPVLATFGTGQPMLMSIASAPAAAT